MLKSYSDCYNTKNFVDSSPSSDENNPNTSNLNASTVSSLDDSSQHSQPAPTQTTPLSSLTNKPGIPGYSSADAYYGGMYGGYHYSMMPSSSPSSLASGQYSIGSLADSCAAAAAAAHWSNGRMSSQFYSNNHMSAGSSTQSAANRLPNTHHRNSTGSTSESSSTSLIDENSPTGFHQQSIPRYPTAANPGYPYPLEAANSTPSQIPQAAAAILNRISRPSESIPLKKRRPVPVEHKDMSYWEKRRKNNESAKKSRDSKREKENQMAVRITYLERENFELKTRCACLMQENQKLTNMLIAANNNAPQSN